MLINLTNHPHNNWPNAQLAEAQKLYGKIIDFPFPAIDPEWDKKQVNALALEYIDKCKKLMEGKAEYTIHIMGEMTFTCRFVCLALEQGIGCVASTTRRLVSTNEQGEKISVFEFVMFREY